MRLFADVDAQVDENDRAFFGFLAPFDLDMLHPTLTNTGFCNYVQVIDGQVTAFRYESAMMSIRHLE